MRTLNVRAAFNALVGLTGRTPATPVNALDPCFGDTIRYRDGMVSTIRFSGTSAWERHTADEILYVVDGFGYVTEIDDDGRHNPQSLSAGIVAIVTAGRWHQVQSDDGISLLAATPWPTEHAQAGWEP